MMRSSRGDDIYLVPSSHLITRHSRCTRVDSNMKNLNVSVTLYSSMYKIDHTDVKLQSCNGALNYVPQIGNWVVVELN